MKTTYLVLEPNAVLVKEFLFLKHVWLAFIYVQMLALVLNAYAVWYVGTVWMESHIISRIHVFLLTCI